MTNVRKQAPFFKSEVREVSQGTFPTNDNSSINSTSWTEMKKLIDESVQGGQLFSSGVGSSLSNLAGSTESFGSVLSPNGELYFVPDYASFGFLCQGVKVLKNGTMATYSLVQTWQFNGYRGGVLAPNGDVHFVPYGTSVHGQKVNINGVVSTYRLLASGNYIGGILAPNGDIHFVPYGASRGQKVATDGTVSTYSLLYTNVFGSYQGGVLSPSGEIHFVPFNTPVGQKVDVNGIVSTYTIPTSGFTTGVLNKDGDVCFIKSNLILKINTQNVINTYTLSQLGSHLAYGAILVPNGDILISPYDGSGVSKNQTYVKGIKPDNSVYYIPITNSVSTRHSTGGTLMPNGDVIFASTNALSNGLNPVKINGNWGVNFDQSVCLSAFFNKY